MIMNLSILMGMIKLKRQKNQKNQKLKKPMDQSNQKEQPEAKEEDPDKIKKPLPVVIQVLPTSELDAK